ncbi:putative retrotransposon ty1-copia subclass protein [Tanacetum coccineum]
MAKESVCHHCKEVAHWRRNYPSYQAELKKRKNASVASTSESRKLKRGALSLYMGNGMRTTVEAIRSFDLILPSGLIIGYALKSAARILNMVPTKKVKRTPYEIWHGKAPKLSYLRVWGCEALVKRDDLKNLILDPLSVSLSARIPQAPNRYGFYVDVEEYELGDLNELPNYKAVLVDVPSNGRTVGSKWLFKKKIDMDGNVHTFKACLVAKGYTQTYGVDYGETFSHVADIRAIRILLAIAAFYDYEI